MAYNPFDAFAITLHTKLPKYSWFLASKTSSPSGIIYLVYFRKKPLKIM